MRFYPVLLVSLVVNIQLVVGSDKIVSADSTLSQITIKSISKSHIIFENLVGQIDSISRSMVSLIIYDDNTIVRFQQLDNDYLESSLIIRMHNEAYITFQIKSDTPGWSVDKTTKYDSIRFEIIFEPYVEPDIIRIYVPEVELNPKPKYTILHSEHFIERLSTTHFIFYNQSEYRYNLKQGKYWIGLNFYGIGKQGHKRGTDRYKYKSGEFFLLGLKEIVEIMPSQQTTFNIEVGDTDDTGQYYLKTKSIKIE